VTDSAKSLAIDSAPITAAGPAVGDLVPNANGDGGFHFANVTYLASDQPTNNVALMVGSSIAEIETGKFTVIGDGPTFFADAHNDTDFVTLQAGTGASTLIAGAGESVLISGSEYGNVLENFDTTLGSHDTMLAGAHSGGGVTFSTLGGNNVIDATASNAGNDTIITGIGLDTITTGTGGATIDLGFNGAGNGSATVMGGAGNDTINVSANAHYDSIDGGSSTNDVVTFQGHTLADTTFNTDASTGITHISFASGGSADVSHVATIVIGSDTISH
jgi:hypothetical protein